MKVLCSVFLSAVLFAPAATAVDVDVELSVDPDPPLVNESFTLTFTATGSLETQPDFAALEDIVQIIGRNRQTSIQWINGEHTQTTTFSLSVITAKPGRITLPSIAFGQARSPAKTLEIVSAAAAQQADPVVDLFLEVEASPTDPYVQQQVIYTVRLYRRVQISNAALSEPGSDADVIIKQLGTDKSYAGRHGGKRYEVFERRYAFYPQTSGRVTLEPMTLTAQIVTGRRSFFDPFGQAMKTKRVASEAITLEVKPIPAAFTGKTWLPARRLTLDEEWDPLEPTVTAGEPLTRTLFLWADGLSAGQLPDLELSLPTDIKSYPEQPQVSEQATEHGFTAVRQQKIALIPSLAAKVEFGAIEVPWWNTETDAEEIASLPARTIVIEAGTPLPPAPGDGFAPQTAPLAGPTAAPIASAPAMLGRTESRLNWITMVGYVGWVLTLVAWLWIARKRRTGSAPVGPESENPDLARSKRDLRGACRAHDPGAAKRALLHWGHSRFSAPGMTTLNALQRNVGESLGGEIARLNTALYGPNPDTWNGEGLWSAFERQAARPEEKPASADPLLPAIFRLT